MVYYPDKVFCLKKAFFSAVKPKPELCLCNLMHGKMLAENRHKFVSARHEDDHQVIFSNDPGKLYGGLGISPGSVNAIRGDAGSDKGGFQQFRDLAGVRPRL